MAQAVTMKNREALLSAIADELRLLKTSPLYGYRVENKFYPVPGEGNPQAGVMFVGEAPGESEAKTGRPFVGASGRVLSQLLDSIGLSREDVFITNIVKDRPPDNRDPSAEEIRLYTPFLLQQIEIIQPKIIATLGRFAMDFILTTFGLPEAGGKISALHGKALRGKANYGDIWVVPLFHPAVALYTEEKRAVLEDDFRVIGKLISQGDR